MILNVSLGQYLAAKWAGILVLAKVLLLDMPPAVGLVSEFLSTSSAGVPSHGSLNVGTVAWRNKVSNYFKRAFLSY